MLVFIQYLHDSVWHVYTYYARAHFFHLHNH